MSAVGRRIFLQNMPVFNHAVVFPIPSRPNSPKRVSVWYSVPYIVLCVGGRSGLTLPSPPSGGAPIVPAKLNPRLIGRGSEFVCRRESSSDACVNWKTKSVVSSYPPRGEPPYCPAIRSSCWIGVRGREPVRRCPKGPGCKLLLLLLLVVLLVESPGTAERAAARTAEPGEKGSLPPFIPKISSRGVDDAAWLKLNARRPLSVGYWSKFFGV